MGVEAGILGASALLGAAGSAKNSSAANSGRGQAIIPQDVLGLRETLANLFEGVAAGQQGDTLSNAVSGRLREVLDPGFLEGFADQFDPDLAIRRADRLTLPSFERDLARSNAGISANLGVGGHRGGDSSATTRILSQNNNEAINNRNAQLQSLFGQLQGQQIGALSLIPQTIGSLGSVLGTSFRPLELATQFGAAGTGGPAAQLQSPGGSFFNAGANALQLFPILDALR